ASPWSPTPARPGTCRGWAGCPGPWRSPCSATGSTPARASSSGASNGPGRPVIGQCGAREIALLDDWVDAGQALQFGLVNRAWPAEDFAREAAAAVAALAAGPTPAFARTKG